MFVARVNTIIIEKPRYPTLKGFRNLTGGLCDSKPKKLHPHQLPSSVVDEVTAHLSLPIAQCSLSPTQLQIGGEDHPECGYN